MKKALIGKKVGMTQIFDEKGNRVIACPTEQEAVEYVREQEQEADREGCEYHECNKPGRKPRNGPK